MRKVNCCVSCFLPAHQPRRPPCCQDPRVGNSLLVGYSSDALGCWAGNLPPPDAPARCLYHTVQQETSKTKQKAQNESITIHHDPQGVGKSFLALHCHYSREI